MLFALIHVQTSGVLSENWRHLNPIIPYNEDVLSLYVKPSSFAFREDKKDKLFCIKVQLH